MSILEDFLKIMNDSPDMEKKLKSILSCKSSNDNIIKLLNFRLAELFQDFENFNEVDNKCKNIELIMKSLILTGQLGDEYMFNEGKRNFELNVENYRKMIESFERAMHENIKEKSDKTPH